MSNHHYEKAPITEALVEIRVKPKAGMTPQKLAEVFSRQDRFGEKFPERQDVLSRSFSNVSPPEALVRTDATSVIRGFRYISVDQRRILQVRPEMMAFSVECEPETEYRYKDWDAFLPEVKDAWAAYRNAAEATEITRIGIRCVNRFKLPEGAIDLSEYFASYPPGLNPDFLPHNSFERFRFRLVMPQPDIESKAIVDMQGSVPSPEGMAGVLLDIDVFHDDLSLASSDEASLWNIVSDLHKRRNAVFEASITDTTRNLIK